MDVDKALKHIEWHENHLKDPMMQRALPTNWIIPEASSETELDELDDVVEIGHDEAGWRKPVIE